MSKDTKHAEHAEAGLELARREYATRQAAYEAALDQMQSAATTAHAENERLRDELGAARQDIDGFVEEIRELNDRLAAETARADGAERAHDQLLRGLGRKAAQ